jgi:RNA recognition motif-containing protein
MNPTRLFVGNLSYQTRENDLQDYFAQAGAVTSVNLMLDKITGKSRGFAFVEFADAEAAQRAIDQFHNQESQGRPLTINVSRPREDRPPRLGKQPRGTAWRTMRTALISSGRFRTDRTFSFTGFLNKGLTPAGSRLS